MHREDPVQENGLREWCRAGIGDVFIFAEIGVAVGDGTRIVLEEFPNLDIYYAIDPFMDPRKDSPYGQAGYEKFMDTVGRDERVRLIRSTSGDALLPPGTKLDRVYIDANHEERYIRFDIKKWWDYLWVYGYMGGHDYSDTDWGRGVIKVVDFFFPTKTLFQDSSWLVQKTKEKLNDQRCNLVGR